MTSGGQGACPLCYYYEPTGFSLVNDHGLYIYVSCVCLYMCIYLIIVFWASVFSENFTILLFHYDGRTSEWDEFEWSKRAIHVSARKQTKW